MKNEQRTQVQEQHAGNETKVWQSESYDHQMAFVSAYGAPLVDLLNIQPGETVIDWGCGTGDLAAGIADKGAVVFGIDASVDMIERARVKHPSIKFAVEDGQRYRSEQPVDAIFSNAALHWMTDAAGTAASIAASLKPGGRFVAEFGGSGNVKAVTDALQSAFETVKPAKPFRHPWYFPTIGEYATLLQEVGFEVNTAMLYDRPTPQVGGDNGIRGWLATFADVIMEGIDAEQAAAIIALTEERLRPALYRDGEWIVDYRRLRVTATKQ
ncbi:Methyltransferase type 11 [Paenibacillus curdlanolyticus YK9]|uniref:Methyltransferase type 11 n=1 Tax=Paenibacillus curdlanolyticus YK9 TaxID=717606 RepID=E0IBI2_9BACL|nr:methyltransferase domain-containing protein [Paenibacillus curdlanolyticus]EFM10062.1 Methyltransferase type 11 [Paenibacillus curdlanolyticus YK9]